MTEQDRQEALDKLDEMIKQINVAMLTTVDEDGTLHSRPMFTIQRKFDGELWFFTRSDSPKVEEVMHGRHVNLSFVDSERQIYISISGLAYLLRDRLMMQTLWSPAFKIFFPEGLEDPALTLLRVTAQRAEYWGSPSARVGQMVPLFKAAAKDAGELGENKRVNL